MRSSSLDSVHCQNRMNAQPRPIRWAESGSRLYIIMETAVYEVVVVGAGVEGSSTAYHLASRRPGKILMLEQVSSKRPRRGCGRNCRSHRRQSAYQSQSFAVCECHVVT